MIVAAPGVGKSVMATNLAHKMSDSLYISLDTDAFTWSARAAAIDTGWPIDKIEQFGIDSVDTGPDFDAMTLASPWSASVSDIAEEIQAYVTVFGRVPQIVFVDNLDNVTPDVESSSDEGYAGGERAVLDSLHKLARKLDTNICVLHHSTGKYEDGNVPIPLSGLMNKVGKLPATILTLTREGENLQVFAVKNRGGPSDPTAQAPINFDYDGPTARITWR